MKSFFFFEEKPLVILTDKLITPKKVLEDEMIIVHEGKITAICTELSAEFLLKARVIDARGLILIPGFLDWHVHGILGTDFSSVQSPDDLIKVAMTLAQEGTTAFLATVYIPSVAALRVIADYIEEGQYRLSVPVAKCVGIHMEAPWISINKGVIAKYAQPYRKELLDKLWNASQGWIRMWTVDPMVENHEQMFEDLAEKDIVVSIGHTDASEELIMKVTQRWTNVISATHVHNAMGPIGRHPEDMGTAGAVMMNENLFLQLIVDLRHVNQQFIKMTLQEAFDRIYLITDKAAVAGLPNGIYECFEQPVEVRDGEIRAIKTGKLAGSSLKMFDAVMKMKQLLERSFIQAVTLTNARDIGTGKEKAALLSEAATRQAVRMATLVPAQVLNKKNLGEISVGKDADLVILNPKNFEVVYTLVGGDIAYQRT